MKIPLNSGTQTNTKKNPIMLVHAINDFLVLSEHITDTKISFSETPEKYRFDGAFD